MVKAQELFEGPYHINSDYRPMIKMDSYPSLEGLNRECEFLGSLDKDGKIYNFWIGKSENPARVTTEATDDIGQLRQLSVVRLDFQSKTGIPVKNELHVHTVYTHTDYRGEFLAGSLYILLARYGHTVVSDFEQWNGGKALWKKLARESEMRKYAVRIWDDKTEDWIRNSNGDITAYIASNLTDEAVWIDISQQCNPTTLLVLSSN